MVGDSFEFRGVNFREKFGIKCVAIDFVLPPKRERKIDIPLRHGKYDYGALNYEQRFIRLDCDLIKPLTKSETREISYILSKKGKLVLWDEPDKYYIGEIYTAPEVFTYPKHVIRSFTLEFICEPFAYSEPKNYPLQKGENKIPYSGTFESPTIITLKNTGRTNITRIQLIETNRR